MNFMESVLVLVTSVFPGGVADRVMGVAPVAQTIVNIILISVYLASFGNGASDDGFDGGLLHVGQHVDHHLTATLHHAENRRLLLLQRAATAFPLQTTTPPLASFFFTAAGWPLCPATTYASSHSTAPRSLTSGRCTTMPSRSWLVIAWTSLTHRSNSEAIC